MAHNISKACSMSPVNEIIITTDETGKKYYDHSLHPGIGHQPQPHLLIIENSECESESIVTCINRILLSCQNVTVLTFMDIPITDEDLSSIFGSKNIQAAIKRFNIINCQKVTSIPYELLSVQLTFIKIHSCNNILSVPDGIVKLINLQGLVIVGTNDSIILPDNLWELNETLQTLIVPRETIFQQSLLDNLHISLLPVDQIPEYKKAMLADFKLKEKALLADFKLKEKALLDDFKLKEREEEILFKLESDRKEFLFKLESDTRQEVFMSSLSFNHQSKDN